MKISNEIRDFSENDTFMMSKRVIWKKHRHNIYKNQFSDIKMNRKEK